MSDKNNWIRVTIESKFYGSRTSVTEQVSLNPERGEDPLKPENFVNYPLSKALMTYIQARGREKLGSEDDVLTTQLRYIIEQLDQYGDINHDRILKDLNWRKK